MLTSAQISRIHNGLIWLTIFALIAGFAGFTYQLEQNAKQQVKMKMHQEVNPPCTRYAAPTIKIYHTPTSI